MKKKKTSIIEPPAEERLVPAFRDPPLKPHGDIKLDEKGQIAGEADTNSGKPDSKDAK